MYILTSIEIINFLKELLDHNKNKKIFKIRDKARIHTSKAVKEFIK
jgi:hypothetical protein